MASKSEIASEIQGLEVHCRPPLMDVEARSRWLADWCNDLAKFEIEAIRAACGEWRQSGATRFPTPGQLLPLIRKRVHEPLGPKMNEAWRPLSDAEYADLTLSEKVRHHKILAHEARCKAGPMWRTPEGSTLRRPQRGHLSPEQLPDDWRRFSRIAENHEAEARRLQDKLIEARRMAAE